MAIKKALNVFSKNTKKAEKKLSEKDEEIPEKDVYKQVEDYIA